MKIFLLIIYFAQLFLKQCISESTDELVAVVVLYRHGDRIISKSYPNDKFFKNTSWPVGPGELLNEGKLRHYELGTYLRNRYSSFLGRYSPKNFYVRSSDYDRCIMSAQSNLAALFPPSGDEIWKKGFNWQPIPVHSVPSESDNILAFGKDCPSYGKLNNKVKNELSKNLTASHPELFNLIKINGGWEEDISINDVQAVYNAFYLYTTNKPSYLPDWYYELTNDERSTIQEIAGISLSGSSYTQQLKRFRAGPFFNHIITYFDSVINGSDTYKFVMLSGHESTVAPILNSMGCYFNEPPEYTATVIWELYKRPKNSKYYISVFYKRNSTANELSPRKVYDCDIICDYGKFRNILKDVTVDQKTWDDECNKVDGLMRKSSSDKRSLHLVNEYFSTMYEAVTSVFHTDKTTNPKLVYTIQ